MYNIWLNIFSIHIKLVKFYFYSNINFFSMISAVPIKCTYDSHEKVVFHFNNVPFM